MPDLRQIHHDILALGRVDTPMLELLRRSLYNRGGGGKIDRPEADVLVDLHKRVERTNPAFEAFYYRAVKDHVLADGAIKPDETLWLRQTLFRDGVISDEERKFLHELKGEARQSCPEFEALFAECMAQPQERHTAG